MDNRDDFSAVVKRTLALRVGYLCSSPTCRASTIGPQEDFDKTTNAGEAAHITAASPGGERYDATLTPEQRTSLDNAIWLCSRCHKIVDRNVKTHSAALLRQWKRTAEQDALFRIGRPTVGLVQVAVGSAPQIGSTSPRHLSPEARALGEKVADARARRGRLEARGVDASDVVREIVSLKRQMREGGQLQVGGELGEGQYELHEKVGIGGFGTVWRALDTQSKEFVAIKVLHSHLAGDPLQLERFVRGARIMSELKHEAVVRVLKAHEEDGGWHYVVMEFVGGGDLRRAALNAPVSEERLFRVMDGVCDAMAMAHSRGIVHRDIKPANILLTVEGTPKLTDFDLVGALDTTGGTGAGFLGTFMYADPFCADHPAGGDARSDVYSLGITMLFCLCGFDLPPHLLGMQEEVICRVPMTFLMSELLLRATRLADREHRFANAGALRDALRNVHARDARGSARREMVVRSRRFLLRLLILPAAAVAVAVSSVPLGLLLWLAAHPPEGFLGNQGQKWVFFVATLLGMSAMAYGLVRFQRWVRRRGSWLDRIM